MITKKINIPYKYGETIRIRPIFDVHFGNRHCDLRAFKKFITEDPDCYFIGGGDLCDAIISADIKRFRQSGAEFQVDDAIDSQVGGMVDLLMPIRNRILGLGTGNHEDAITRSCGTNITKRICQRLEVPFLGFSWFLNLAFRTDNGGGRTVIIKGHHGWGGGSRTQGADITKFAKDCANYDADIYLFGHVHRLQNDFVPRVGVVGELVIAKPKLMCICGTFLKTLSLDENPTYSEIIGYPPVQIGGLTINIHPNRSWVKYWASNQ